MPKSRNTTSLAELIEQEYGNRGTQKRQEFEKGYGDFKLGYLLQEARRKKGLTQQQLADKVGTNKAYISRVENDIKDVRLSTLQRIVEVGLGGELELAIKL